MIFCINKIIYLSNNLQTFLKATDKLEIVFCLLRLQKAIKNRVNQFNNQLSILSYISLTSSSLRTSNSPFLITAI